MRMEPFGWSTSSTWLLLGLVKGHIYMVYPNISLGKIGENHRKLCMVLSMFVVPTALKTRISFK